MLQLVKLRRRKLWILLGCGIAVVLIVMLLREREPHYKGRSLSQWIALLNNSERDGPQHEAEGAVRHIGTNALPFLLRWIQYKEQPWRTRVGTLCYKFPEKVAGPLSRLVVGRGRERQDEAFSALYVLGPEAKAAIPILTRLAVNHTFVTEPAMIVLAHIGNEGLPPILTVLTNPGNPDRILAVIALSDDSAKFTFNQSAEAALIRCLDDPDRELAFRAAGLLCCHNLEKERVLQIFVEALISSESDKRLRQKIYRPLKSCLMEGFSLSTLLQFLQDTNSPLSIHAASALGEMAERGAPLPKSACEALMHALHDPRPSIRNCAAGNIAYFPDSAELVVPTLLDLWSDPDESVRRIATNTVFRMPPYTILEQVDLLDKNGLSGLSMQAKMMWFERYGGGPPGPALARLLDHPDPRIREMATNAFRKLRDTSSGSQTAKTPNN
jgi:HEAT repeat protein